MQRHRTVRGQTRRRVCSRRGGLVNSHCVKRDSDSTVELAMSLLRRRDPQSSCAREHASSACHLQVEVHPNVRVTQVIEVAPDPKGAPKLTFDLGRLRRTYDSRECRLHSHEQIRCYIARAWPIGEHDFSRMGQDFVIPAGRESQIWHIRYCRGDARFPPICVSHASRVVRELSVARNSLWLLSY